MESVGGGLDISDESADDSAEAESDEVRILALYSHSTHTTYQAPDT